MAKRPPIPRCPGNPSDYVLVKTKRGYHWRHKRYTFTPVKLNAVFEENAKGMGKVSPVVSFILTALNEFAGDLDNWSTQGNMIGAIMQGKHAQGFGTAAALEGFDFQPSHRFKEVMKADFRVRHLPAEKKFQVGIAIADQWPAVKPLNKYFTGYQFVVAMLYGDFNQKRGEVISNRSRIFSAEEPAQTCTIELEYGDARGNFLLCLRAESYEGKELANNSSSRGMMVVKAGVLKDATLKSK